MSFQDVSSSPRCSEFDIIRQPRMETHRKDKTQIVVDTTLLPQSMLIYRKSTFAQLSGEIVHFQKMVTKLQKILEQDRSSAENKWKSRIIFRSLKETDCDIRRKLQEHDCNLQLSVSDAKAGSAYQKLNRDFNRIHGIFQGISSTNKSLLDGDIPSPVEWPCPKKVREKVVAQEKEDFFERTMRERATEMKGIHKSMHQVNEIYRELSHILQNQQEQVDNIEDNTRYARANAECGKDIFKKCNSPSPIDKSDDNKRENFLNDSDFRWSMPFETIKEDMRAVQMDILGLGKDIVALSSKRPFICELDTVIATSI